MLPEEAAAVVERPELAEAELQADGPVYVFLKDLTRRFRLLQLFFKLAKTRPAVDAVREYRVRSPDERVVQTSPVDCRVLLKF